MAILLWFVINAMLLIFMKDLYGHAQSVTLNLKQKIKIKKIMTLKVLNKIIMPLLNPTIKQKA